MLLTFVKFSTTFAPCRCYFNFETALAQFAYEPQEEGELEFLEGQTIIVVAEDESGWGMGYVEGAPDTKGVFPLNYVAPNEAVHF